MILLLRWKHQHEEQRASFLEGSKQMKVDFSCLMTLVGDDDDDEDEVVLPLFSRFIPSCVHSEATCCIDRFTKDWHSDDTHMRILIQNGQKKMETHSVLLYATMCYLSISSIL